MVALHQGVCHVDRVECQVDLNAVACWVGSGVGVCALMGKWGISGVVKNGWFMMLMLRLLGDVKDWQGNKSRLVRM